MSLTNLSGIGVCMLVAVARYYGTLIGVRYGEPFVVKEPMRAQLLRRRAPAKPPPPCSSSGHPEYILEYNGRMRVKTSITLPKDLVRRIDQVDRNRSAFLERASLAYLSRMERAARDARDLEIINRNARRLNREAEDVLEYQGLP